MLKIEILVGEDIVKAGAVGQYLTNMLQPLGYTPLGALANVFPPPPPSPEPRHDPVADKIVDDATEVAETGVQVVTQGAVTQSGPVTPGRERGKPAPGKKRRTAEEVAEDAALDAAGSPSAAQTETQAISSGEERTGPDDAPEVQEQDAADEKAEAEAQVDPAKPLTADDLRNVMTKYVQAFGMAATQEDGPKVFKATFGAPPADETGWKVSVIDAQGKIGEAIAAWEEALAKNPFGRTPVKTEG